MKNKFILGLILGIFLIGIVSASITGYLVSRGGGISDAGYTATLKKVEGTTAIVSVQTPTGDTELVRVAEGETAKVGEAQISASELKKGNLFTRGGANVEINVEEGFMFATWECYDGDAISQGDETSCKSSETWQKYAQDFCKGHCNKDETKCGVNSFSVTGECGEQPNEDEETELSCKKYDYDEGILGTFGILFWRIEGTSLVQFFESSSPTSNPISKQLNIGDTFTLPDGTTATIYDIDLTTGSKTIVIIKICGDVSGGSGDTKSHTHLTDYKYVTGDLNLDGQTQSYKEYAGKIDCAVKFGKGYVVLGGGYELSPEISAGYIIEANGPASKTVYLVSLRDYNIQYQNLTGSFYATCARIEPTLHQFGQDY